LASISGRLIVPSRVIAVRIPKRSLSISGGRTLGGGLVLAVGVLVTVADRAIAQRGDGTGLGITAPGDELRGQARFLRGMAWYEIGSAQAGALQLEAMIEWNRAVRADYEQYLRARANRLSRARTLNNERQADAAERLEELRRRWRENPTRDDIRSGSALNALASDLADPAFTPDDWRTAPVSLPPDVSIQALAFRFTDSSGPRTPSAVGPTIVAIGRMKGEHWPIALRRTDLAGERADYERAARRVVAACAKNQKLQAADFDRVRDRLAALKSRAAEVVPFDQRKQALAHLDQLDRATRFLLDRAIAEELIRDVETHRAKTVGELLGFMKKYRLLFAEAEQDPDTWAVYETIYRLLKSQRLEFAAIKPMPAPAPAAAPGPKLDDQRVDAPNESP
jgi:hypothetical protein